MEYFELRVKAENGDELYFWLEDSDLVNVEKNGEVFKTFAISNNLAKVDKFILDYNKENPKYIDPCITRINKNRISLHIDNVDAQFLSDLLGACVDASGYKMYEVLCKMFPVSSKYKELVELNGNTMPRRLKTS